jgi:hypothetical protein
MGIVAIRSLRDCYERVLDSVLRIRDAAEHTLRDRHHGRHRPDRISGRRSSGPHALSHSSGRGAKLNAFFAFAFDAPRSRVP